MLRVPKFLWVTKLDTAFLVPFSGLSKLYSGVSPATFSSRVVDLILWTLFVHLEHSKVTQVKFAYEAHQLNRSATGWKTKLDKGVDQKRVEKHWFRGDNPVLRSSGSLVAMEKETNSGPSKCPSLETVQEGLLRIYQMLLSGSSWGCFLYQST